MLRFYSITESREMSTECPNIQKIVKELYDVFPDDGWIREKEFQLKLCFPNGLSDNITAWNQKFLESLMREAVMLKSSMDAVTLMNEIYRDNHKRSMVIIERFKTAFSLINQSDSDSQR